MYNYAYILYNKCNESDKDRKEALRMRIFTENYDDGLLISVTGAIKDGTGYGCAGFYVRNGGNRHHIILSKNGQIRINEFPKELDEATNRFNEIVNTYFENGL